MMLRTVFDKALWDQRRALVGYGGGIVILVMVEGALWPSIRDMSNLDQLLANYPDALKELFDLDSMSTGRGFLNAELFTLMLPALFIIYGISRGSRLVAGEEEAGTLAVVLVTPVSTTRVLMDKAAGLVVGLVVLGALAGMATLLASVIFAMGIPVQDVVIGSLACVLIGTEFGWLALAAGAMTGRHALAISIASAAAVAAYVLYAAGAMVDGLRPWRPWSPFHQALGQGPMSADLPQPFLWLVVGGAAMLALAVPMFARRDIRVG